MPESRSARFRGRSPPDRPDWSVSTVAKRGTNRSETATCAVTRTDLPLDGPHFYVTLIRESRSPVHPGEYDHLVVADGALGELEEWLGAE